MKRFATARHGVSLIELLVVMMVIGLLLALILPAVQASRATARRTHCANNLRQIGMAMLSYHQAKRSFPPGGIEWRPPGNKTRRQIAWSAFLLPFIGEQEVYDVLDLSTAFDSPQNVAGAATVIPTYVCPSTYRSGQLIDGRGPIDYGGIYGERITSPNNPPKGTMLYDRPVTIAMIPDGTSVTLLVSEDSGWAEGQWINGRNIFDQAFRINHAPPYENDIRSEHPDGANGLFADGSIRFLHETIDLRVLAAICTRAGRELDHSF